MKPATPTMLVIVLLVAALSFGVVSCQDTTPAPDTDPIMVQPEGTASEFTEADFVGTWINRNDNTHGITRFNIYKDSSNELRARIFGRCRPRDCDWGAEELITYGSSVSDKYRRFASMNYRFSHSNKILIFEMKKVDVIYLKGFSEFTDGSDRENVASAWEVFDRH